MTVDIHAHAFPPLSEASGYESSEAHLRCIQEKTSQSDQMRFEGELPRPDEEVEFKVGRYGKFEWVKNGRNCFLRYMSPAVVDTAWPPEHMLAYMDWMGVDKAVLYQGHIYGRLNDYLADCVKRWPDRFAALAQIDEFKASEESQLTELKRSVKINGLKGLYFEVPHRPCVDDRIFDLFWDEFMTLKVPIVLELGRPPTAKQYMEIVSGTEKVLRKYPDIRAIVPVMGSNIRDPQDPEYVEIPKDILNLIQLPNVWYEIGYLLAFDKLEEYPYPRARKMTREAYESVGADNLVWGSDMPMLMRACTYRQGIDFVRRHCDFLSEAEKDLILGENASNLFDL